MEMGGCTTQPSTTAAVDGHAITRRGRRRHGRHDPIPAPNQSEYRSEAFRISTTRARISQSPSTRTRYRNRDSESTYSVR